MIQNVYWGVGLLMLILILGFIVLVEFPASNGFIQFLDVQLVALYPEDKPAGTALVRTALTPLRAVQRIPVVLAINFPPATTAAESSGFLLHFVYFFGQGVAMWTMTAVEGMRRGNRRYAGQLVAAASVVVAQAIGMAIVGPIVLAVSLMNKDVVQNPTWQNLGASSKVLRAVPWSMFIGFVIPTVAMVMLLWLQPAAQWKMFVINVWLYFPVCFNNCQLLLTSFILPHLEMRRKTPTTGQSDEQEIVSLRTCYRQGLALALVTHISTWAASLSALWFPELFDPHASRESQPNSVFVPPLPRSGNKARTLTQGFHWIMLWDDVLMGVIYLLWAATLLRCCNVSMIRIFRLALTSVLVGPCGAALLMVWERDEMVYNKVHSKNPHEGLKAS